MTADIGRLITRYGIGLTVPLLLVFVPAHVMVSIATLTAILLLVAGLNRLMKSLGAWSFVCGVFLISLTLRLMLAVVLYLLLDYVHGEPFVLASGGDDTTYHKWSSEVALGWQAAGGDIIPADLSAYKGYIYFNAALYWLFGHSTLIARFANCFLAALVVVYVYKLGRIIYDERVARLSAILTACFPSFLLWSSLQYKDTLLVFLVIFAVYNSMRVVAHFNWFRLIGIGLAIYGIYSMRLQAAIILTGIISVYFFFKMKAGNKRKFAFLMTAILGWIVLIVTRTGYTDYVIAFLGRGPEFLEIRFGQFGAAGIGSVKELFANSYFLLPYAVAAMVMPLPTFFSLRSPYDIVNQLDLAGNLAWQILLPFFAIGLIFSFKSRRSESFMIYSWVIATIIGLCLLFLVMVPRHRVQIMPFNMILVAAGICASHSRRFRLWLIGYYVVCLPLAISFFNYYRLKLHGLF